MGHLSLWTILSSGSSKLVLWAFSKGCCTYCPRSWAWDGRFIFDCTLKWPQIIFSSSLIETIGIEL